MPSTRKIGVPADFFQFPSGDVFPPRRGAIGRHHDVVRPRPSRPHIEVLPFQKRIDWPSQVEGEQVCLGTEKQNDVRARRVRPDRRSESALLTFGLAAGHFDVNQECPHADDSRNDDGQPGDCGETAAHTGGLPNPLRAAPDEQSKTGIRGEKVVRPFEFGE